MNWVKVMDWLGARATNSAVVYQGDLDSFLYRQSKYLPLFVLRVSYFSRENYICQCVKLCYL